MKYFTIHVCWGQISLECIPKDKSNFNKTLDIQRQCTHLTYDW